MPAALSPADLESLYERLARALDGVDPGEEGVLLAKLALALAREMGDTAAFERALRVAQGRGSAEQQ